MGFIKGLFAEKINWKLIGVIFIVQFVFEKEVSVEIVNTIVNGATECTFEILGLKEEGVYIFKR